MPGKKFYTVWRGNETGVFDNWNDCKKAVDGYQGAIYKSFPSEEMAWKAFEGNYAEYMGKDKRQSKLSAAQRKAIGEPIPDSISVDAACSSKTEQMEYRGVDTKSGAEFFRKGPYSGGSNNIGEFLAIVHALAWCKQHNLHRPIYTDSHTAMTWVRNKKAKTKVQPGPNNLELFNLIRRAEKWLRENRWDTPVLKWETEAWGEIPADFGRK
ncbi:MAG: ribonuclease H [Bacteroidia bacterium]|nr:MAG: ribonuclease H [Bacteroidia bacterium]